MQRISMCSNELRSFAPDRRCLANNARSLYKHRKIAILSRLRVGGIPPLFGRIGVATVAHSLSAKKRVRQSLKRRARNRARKDQLKLQVKSFMAALAAHDIPKAEKELRATVSRLDKVASKNTIHKNAAARKRSRLAKKLNAMKASPAKGSAAK
jgi:small subunit ribosomal protein S20